MGLCYHVQRLVVGVCHLMHIRVCPQAPQFYTFLILRNKMELIHQKSVSWRDVSAHVYGLV